MTLRTTPARPVPCVLLAFALLASGSLRAAQPPDGASLFAGQAPIGTGAQSMALLFDTSALSTEQLNAAVTAAMLALEQVSTRRMSIVTLDPGLRIVADFTSQQADLRAALESVRTPDPTGSRATPQLADAPSSIQSARARSIGAVCETMAPFQDRKALVYFSAGPSALSGDDQRELRAALATCARSNVSVYPVDARGLSRG
jgi:VWFA-related protein